jgi:hypothetical protein
MTRKMNSLYIDQSWELKLIDSVAHSIRKSNWLNGDRPTAILQLSYEYSGLFAQVLAHRLSSLGEPMSIEPVNIPYKNEFPVLIHPDKLDPYTKLIVLDSGCLSGNNFTKVQKQLIDYGFRKQHLQFVCLACSSESIFKPDHCPLLFDGSSSMVHFWWECKTNKFDR